MKAYLETLQGQQCVIIHFSDGTQTDRLKTKIQFLDALDHAVIENKITRHDRYDLWKKLFAMGKDTIGIETVLDDTIVLLLMYFRNHPTHKEWLKLEMETKNKYGRMYFYMQGKWEPVPELIYSKPQAYGIINMFQKYGLLTSRHFANIRQSILGSPLPKNFDAESN